ncbi:hypothetical protein [Streptomyces narbonensis]|uniref:hypothetical protein n=1 Tax=Streptomyces narbonensis TaxID=67333 RepID=UPI003410746C
MLLPRFHTEFRGATAPLPAYRGAGLELLRLDGPHPFSMAADIVVADSFRRALIHP